MPRQLVDSVDAAAILGVTRPRLVRLASDEPDFPTAEEIVSSGRKWTRLAILEWALRHPESPSDPGQIWQPTLTFAGVLDQVRPVMTLANNEANHWHHSWRGVEHLELALLNPECPGLAPLILESYGLVFDAVRKEFAEWWFGDPYDHPEIAHPSTHGIVVGHTSQLDQALHRAQHWAIRRRDDVVRSEHLLLASGDDEPDQWSFTPIGEQLLRRSVTQQQLRDRILRVSEEVEPRGFLSQLPPPPPATPRPTFPAYSEEFARSPIGDDPRLRRPWSTRLIVDKHDEPVELNGEFLSCFIDRDGFPVRTTDGRVLGRRDRRGAYYTDDEPMPGPQAFYLPPGTKIAGDPFTTP